MTKTYTVTSLNLTTGELTTSIETVEIEAI